MKLIASILIAFALSACATTGNVVVCTIEQTAATGIATSIGMALQCSNVAEIKRELDSVMQAAGICKQPATMDAQGKMKLPAPLCSIIQGLVVNEIAPVAIPDAWRCSAQNAKALLKTVVMTACQAL